MNIVLISFVIAIIILGLIAINSSLRKFKKILLIRNADNVSIHEAVNRDDVVRINGAARKYDKILYSPINNKECFAYKYEISKRRKSIFNSTDTEWTPIENGDNATDFILEDKTGTAYIHTNNADISLTNESIGTFSSLKSIPDMIKENNKFSMNIKEFNFDRSGKLRFKEDVLKSGENMFIIGKFNNKNVKNNETIEINKYDNILISDKEAKEKIYALLTKSVLHFISGILIILTALLILN